MLVSKFRSLFCSALFLGAMVIGWGQTSAQSKLSYLALGDSYTIGESVAEKDRWPNQLADRLAEKGIEVAKPEIIAQTGWTTDELIEAMGREELEPGYDVVSLLIGVNNQFRGYSLETCKEETESLLATAIQLAGGDPGKVFMVSIPNYGYTPFGEKNKEEITKDLARFNAAGKMAAEQYGVKFVNITPVSEEDQENWVAKDGLHPSGAQYGGWVKVIANEVQEIFTQ